MARGQRPARTGISSDTECPPNSEPKIATLVAAAQACGACREELPRVSLDRLHIGVRQPEMVADLMDQDVTDDMAQRFLMLGPVIQDRPPVEPDHVGQAGDVLIALLWQADALEQAEQVELCLLYTSPSPRD